MKKGGKGGANTNRGGLAFEQETDLSARIQRDLSDLYFLEIVDDPAIVKRSTKKVYRVIRRKDNHLIGYIAKQSQFYNVMKYLYGLGNQNHKRWEPDEAFFNLDNQTIFIIEKKWQQTNGSVDEKIFGFVNKRRLYQNNFNQLIFEPKPMVEFGALFNRSWWLDGRNGRNERGYQDYFDSLRIDGIKLFFDNYDYWWFGL